MNHAGQLLPITTTGPVVVSAFILLICLQAVRPLLPRREPFVYHTLRNFILAAIGLFVIALTEQQAVLYWTRHFPWNENGLLLYLRNRPRTHLILSVLLIDYTLYLWHVLTHRVPLLWRFHLPHHIDLDCDTSTALRFHMGELVLSVPFRIAQMALIGVSLSEYSIWQTLTVLSVLFHHSNLDLGRNLDDFLALFVVTPRLHHIHHDSTRRNADSNWSSGLSVWDRIHRTLRSDVRRMDISTGVPAYNSEKDATLERTLIAPLLSRNDWAAR